LEQVGWKTGVNHLLSRAKQERTPAKTDFRGPPHGQKDTRGFGGSETNSRARKGNK